MQSAEHRALAQQNEEFAAQFPPDRFDWRITVLFYAALHLVQAYLETKGQRPGKHDERTRLIKADVNLALIAGHYEHLSKMCWNARYQGFRPTEAQYTNAQQAHYQPLKARVLHLLGQ